MVVIPQATSSDSFAFIICTASGHINPSFPIARTLVERGHAVHYLAGTQMREAIEDTGAAFHEDVRTLPELYDGRCADAFGAMATLAGENGIADDELQLQWTKLRNVQLELQLPGVLRFLRGVKARAVIFCPMMNYEAAIAARILKIPAIALLTVAGPGSFAHVLDEFLDKMGRTAESAAAEVLSFEPDHAAIGRINEQYGLDLRPGRTWFEPKGFFSWMVSSSLALVTTSEDLQDPVPEDLASAYSGVRFEFVGALLDKQGAVRAGTHKLDIADEKGHRPSTEDADATEVVAKVRAARAAGRHVVLVSMGTVLTGDAPEVGWKARLRGPDGMPWGLTGRELCQAAWGGAFDAFGSATADEGALLIVSLGQQDDALGALVAPPNAICMSSVPQVDVIKAGVDIFLTHGGQNSFTEGLSNGVPLLVCPGFGDQAVNSRKAVKLGAGLKVDRPFPAPGAEAEAAAQYRADVCRSLLALASSPSYKSSAVACAERLRLSGGVPRAVELILEAAMAPAKDAAHHESKAAQAADDTLTASAPVACGGA